jgi:hypothetical protein
MGRISKGEEVFFDKVGETSSAIEYANVQIPIDLLAAEASLKALCAALLDEHKHNKGRKELEEHYAHKFAMQRCNTLVHRVTSLLNLTKSLPSPDHRNKRALFTIFAILIATVAVSYGVYKVGELIGMNNKANTLLAHQESLDAIGTNSMGIESLAHSVEEFSKNAADYYFDMRLAQFTDHLLNNAESHVRALENTVQTAFLRRVHLDTLTIVNTTRVATDMDEYAQRIGAVPLARFPTDWLQHETSFKATGNGFDIFLHVPLVQPNSAMTVYRHVPLPMAIDEDLELEVNPMIDFLAISNDGKFFKTLSSAQLNLCRKIADHFVCNHQNVVRKAPETLDSVEIDDGICAWSLFLRKFDFAKKACNAHIKSRSSKAFQLSANAFLLYNHKPEVVAITCRNHSTDIKRNLQVHKATKIPLPAGCSAETEEFVLHASDAGFLAPDDRFTRHWNWKGYADAFVADIDLDRLKTANIDGVNAFAHSTRMHVSTARRILKDIEFKERNSIITWLNSGSIFSIIVIIAIVYIAFKFCKTGGETNNNYLPAYSAAPPNAPNTLCKTAASILQTSGL